MKGEKGKRDVVEKRWGIRTTVKEVVHMKWKSVSFGHAARIE